MLNQVFDAEVVPDAMMDQLWAAGWRHFGTGFFRYSHTIESGDIKLIQPLRLRLSEFSLSKSQSRVRKKNRDLRHELVPAGLRSDTMDLFQRHKQRFSDCVPDGLTDMLSETPDTVPCACSELRVYEADQFLASSFLDVGQRATSSLYGVFDPEHHRRSLGIFTMLLEIQWSIDTGKEFYYPGYATQEAGLYDYKKQFRGLEYLDWSRGEWCALERINSTPAS